MLWLTGLMGIIGAGAASLVLPQSESDEEPNDTSELYLEPNDGLDGYEDLLTFSDNPVVSEDVGEAPFLLSGEYGTFDEASTYGSSYQVNTAEDGDDFEEDTQGFHGSAEQDTSEALYQGPVALGDWINEGAPSEEINYHPDTERLMLVWDDLVDGATEPDVRVEHDLFDPDAMHVVMNDYSIAEIHGDPDLSAADLTVIPLSSALIVGLEPA